MTTHTKKRYTLRLTAQLEELVEARRVELGKDALHLAYHARDEVTTAYALTHTITRGMILAQNNYAELGPVTGATTRTTALYINPVFNPLIEELAQAYELSIHATLRALIVAGASS